MGTQQQVQLPQKLQRRMRLSRKHLFFVTIAIGASAITVVWILSGLSIIPTIWTLILSAFVSVCSVMIGLLPLIFSSGKLEHSPPILNAEKLTWSQLCNICKDITQHRMATVRGKYQKELYLQRDKVRKNFEHFLNISEKRGFVLVGKSGVGKSSFLLALREELQSRSNVCILMYDGANLQGSSSITEIISQDFSNRLVLSRQPVQQVWHEVAKVDDINKRQVILCIDAINENPQARELLKQLNELVQNPWPWLKIVFSSRTETWKEIKRGVKLAEALYYREQGEEMLGVELEPFSYSEQMESFLHVEELPNVYAKYQNEFDLQTPYEELSKELREILRDPLNLWLIASTYRGKAIPKRVQASELIEYYLRTRHVQTPIQRRDLEFLENRLMPLMVREDHYSNVITTADLEAVGGAMHDMIYSEQLLSDGQQMNQSFRRLLEADILMQQEQEYELRIAFKYERFYEHFAGKQLFHLSETQIDRYTFFLDLIEETARSPFLWGAVKNALVQEAKKPASETILKFCRTMQLHVKEIMVSVLTTLGADAPQKVESILKELVPVTQQVTEFKKVRQWLGKDTIDADVATRNAGRIAAEVASNLNISWLLQTAALQEDSTIRTEAIRFAYRLWKRDHQMGFAILEYLTQRSISGLIPERAALESTAGLSMSILFENYHDEMVLRKLRSSWREIIADILHARENGNLRERILRRSLPELILSTIIKVIFNYIHGLPDYGATANYSDLEAFFQLGATEKTLYKRLVSYIDAEGNYSRDQMDRDFLAVMMQTNNALIVFIVQLGLIAHACHDPLAFLPFLQRFFEETKKDVIAYPYMNDVIHVLDNVLHRGPIDDVLFNFFVSTVEECQEFYIRHPEAIRNRHYRTTPEAHNLGPYIFHMYRKTGAVKTKWLEMGIQGALERKDTTFFRLLLTAELPLIGIERQSPNAALLTVAMFFQCNNAAIRSMIQAFLAHLRAYYPNEVDDFLEEQHVDYDFRLQVQMSEPEENIGALIGQRSLYFLRDNIIMQSPTLRSYLLHVFSKAADCRNIRVWLDYFLREVINLIYGGKILHLPK